MNVYYLYGPSTVDEIIFHLIDLKSTVISDTLDGQAKNYQLSRASKTDCIEQVLDLKEKGQLNPTIAKPKKTEQKIEDFFKKAGNQEFIKRKLKESKKSKKIDTEEIENSSDDEDIVQT